jgi:hypothetical protein
MKYNVRLNKVVMGHINPMGLSMLQLWGQFRSQINLL